jgi:phage terminase large subunit
MTKARKIMEKEQAEAVDEDFSIPFVPVYQDIADSTAARLAGYDYENLDPSTRWVRFTEQEQPLTSEFDVWLPVKAQMLFKPKRYKTQEGGRGSSKSRNAATALILMATSKRIRVLCTRELQHSISESVHKLLEDTIHRLGYQRYYTITKTHIRCRNGSEFIFSGIKNNTNKITSMEDISICWAEEAAAITEESWKLLTPTIRADASEIWVVFNAYDEMDATYQRFVAPFEAALTEHGAHSDDTHSVERINYTDNPFFPDVLRAEMDKMKEDHYRDYLHVWMGQPVGASENAIIDPLWIKAAIDAHIKLGWAGKGVKSLGFDPADGGADSKAYVIRHGSLVTHCRTWYKGDITDAIHEAFTVAADHRVTDLVFDAVGVGAAVKHHIRTLEGRDAFTTTGFLGNDIPERPQELYKDDRAMHDVFRNRRAQAFWFLRDRFFNTYQAVEKGAYIDPDTMISLSSDMEGLKILVSELSRIERKRGATNNNLIQIESKDDMKRRGLKSPGAADSLMYAFSNPHIPDGWGDTIDYGNKAVI